VLPEQRRDQQYVVDLLRPRRTGRRITVSHRQRRRMSPQKLVNIVAG
jgi:hypothetical protein